MSTDSFQGRTIGQYRIDQLLGDGGFGVVYLARDLSLNRQVAIKVLRPELTGDESARKRFIREAQAVARLSHPNICAIHQIGEEDGCIFIVMQYLEGETLAHRINRKRLTSRETFDIAIQIAGALAEAHSLNIIHRDIKPQNVMISARGQAMILDFGLAKVVTNIGELDHEAETESMLTEAGVIIGTVPYMSPEQLKAETLDARSDIFSFGIILYEMLTGHQPFVARTKAEIISAILVSEPPSLSSYLSEVPSQVEMIVRKCLAKDRLSRYQTAGEIVADLESVRNTLANLPSSTLQREKKAKIIEVGPSTNGSNTSHFAHRLWLALVTFLVLAVLVTSTVLFLKRYRSVPSDGTSGINSVAYDLYLRGKIDAGSENSEKNASAIHFLEQAVKADPNFAPAFAQLGRAYCIKAFYLPSEAERSKLLDDAKLAVEKSLVLNPSLAEGHYARAYVMWTQPNRFPHEQAIQSLKRAIALDPNLEEAHHELGLIYFHIGLLDKAEQEIKKALEINPSDTLARFRLGSIDVCRANYEEALAILKTVPSEVNPAIVDRATAVALLQLGRTEEAREVVEKYLKSYSTDEGGNVTSVKAIILARAGKDREAEETIQRAIEIGKNFQHFHHTAYNIASAYAVLHKTELALKWLQATADDGFPCYPLFEKDANLANLKKDERFIAFMSKLRKEWEHRAATL